MKWYTAIGIKTEDDEGRLLVKIGGQEKVLTEIEAMLWAALTWSVCEENRIYSQMYRVLCITFGEEKATEWADEEDFLFCLRRLKKRGLVAECDGESKEEAFGGLLLSKICGIACHGFVFRAVRRICRRSGTWKRTENRIAGF